MKITNGSKTLAATVQMCRSQGSRNAIPMHITITDKISGCRVCEVWMALDEFTKALTSSQGAAQMEWFSDAPIGMKAENKEEFVPFTNDNTYGEGSEERIAKALAPFEVDGWTARHGDMGNHHRGSDATGYRVVFFRHVDPETGEPRRIK